jgi:hypothetical protein
MSAGLVLIGCGHQVIEGKEDRLCEGNRARPSTGQASKTLLIP